MSLRSFLSDSGFCVLLFFVSFAFLLLSINRELGVYDEGLVLVGATRVANGDIPHRDFYTLYGPAQYYILAGFFKLLPVSVLVERLWDVVTRAMVATVVFLIVQQGGVRREAYLAYAISLIWLSFFAFYGFPIFPALFLALLSVLFLFRALQAEQSRLMLLLSGATVGLTALFRYEVGFLTFFSESLVIVAFAMNRSGKISEKLFVLLRLLLLYGVGITTTFLPVAFTYLAYAPVKDFIFDVSASPSHYAQTRSLAFPSWYAMVKWPETIAIYLPIIISCTALFLMSQIPKRTTQLTEQTEVRNLRWLTVLLIAITTAFYLKGVVRVSVIHMALSIIPALVLLGIVFKSRWEGNSVTAAVIYLTILVAAVPTWVAARAIMSRTYHNIDEFYRFGATACGVPEGLERIACFKTNENRIAAALFVQKQTADTKSFFSGAWRHDKIFANDMMIYFMAKRQPATKWDIFDPAIQTTASVQNEIISELQSKQTRIVVLKSEWDSIEEPNASALSSGVATLDEYIKRHYEIIKNYGTISVLARRGSRIDLIYE